MANSTRYLLDGYVKSYRNGELSVEEYDDCVEAILYDEYNAGRISAGKFFALMHEYFVA